MHFLGRQRRVLPRRVEDHGAGVVALRHPRRLEHRPVGVWAWQTDRRGYIYM